MLFWLKLFKTSLCVLLCSNILYPILKSSNCTHRHFTPVNEFSSHTTSDAGQKVFCKLNNSHSGQTASSAARSSENGLFGNHTKLSYDPDLTNLPLKTDRSITTTPLNQANLNNSNNYSNRASGRQGSVQRLHRPTHSHSQSSSQSPITFVILDVAHQGPTMGYSVTFKGPKKIFRANSPYLFGKVLNGSETLWESSGNGFPYKVVYQNISGRHKVKVFFPEQQPSISRLEVIRPGWPPPVPTEPATSVERLYGSPTAPLDTGTSQPVSVGQPVRADSATSVSVGQSASSKPLSKLKIFVQDPNDSNRSFQINPSVYAPSDLNEIRFITYDIKGVGKCTCVKYKDETAWKYDSEKKSKYPKSVSWHESYYLVLIQFEDDLYRLYNKTSNNEWRSKNLRKTSHLDQAKIKLYTKNDSNLVEMDSNHYEFRDMGFAFEFVFKDQAKCEKLKYDEASIYTYNTDHNKENYPSVLYVFSNRSGQVFYPTASFPLESPIDLLLDLKKDTAGTSKFDYKKVKNLVTYTAKQGYGFSVVTTKTKKGSCSCCGSGCCGTDSEVDIWYDPNNTEYATKVVLNGKGKSTKTVTIEYSNGTKRVFKKSGKNKDWIEQNVS